MKNQTRSMRTIVSLILCILLLGSVFLAAPRASADEMPSLPPEIPEELRRQIEEMYQMYHCIPIPGGAVQASELEEGGSYTFIEDAVLELDTDICLKTLCCAGSLTITGDASLSAEIVYAFDGRLRVEADVECPVMENPPESGLTWCNGLSGLDGIVIDGGSVDCPDIWGCRETVSIDNANVRADYISAINGYDQSDSVVEAGMIYAREGFYMGGGQLTVGYVWSWNVVFSGGVSIVDTVETERDDDFVLEFPMAITEPAGARYQGGRFVDALGNPVDRVRIERLSISNPFLDVAPAAYYYNPVMWAVYSKITNGVKENLFGPDRGCTRAQAVTFLWRASGCPAPEKTDLAFADVPNDAYYADAVRWAVEKGITTGTSAKAFSPDRPCTRAQIITFIWRFAGSPAASWLSYYNDVPETAYYFNAANWAEENGIANGTSEGHFSPLKDCTRAEIVTFLFRFFN